MSAIPPQLPWRRFVCVLRDLGYRPLKSHRGSLRQFFCSTRDPNLFSFHEPHSGDRSSLRGPVHVGRHALGRQRHVGRRRDQQPR